MNKGHKHVIPSENINSKQIDIFIKVFSFMSNKYTNWNKLPL